MSKWSDEFIQVHETTGKLRKRTAELQRINRKEAEKIDRMLKRFKPK